MTSPTSPKELLADYRQQSRQDAAEHGRPIDRSAFPGLLVETTGMIFIARDVLMYHPLGSPAVPLTADMLNAQLVEMDSSIVVADAGTLSALAAFAESAPASDPGALRRRLAILAALGDSVKLPVLTKALATRYWLPDGLDEESLADWAEALEVKGPTNQITMRSLIALARDGMRLESLNYEKTVSSIEALERRMMDSAVYSDVGNDCTMLERLEVHNAKITGLRALDPGLLEMHMIDGQVSRVTPLGVTFTTFTAKVSSPFKLKEGRDGVRLTDGYSVVSASLDELRYGEGVLHAVLTIPTRGKFAESARQMVQRAHDGHGPLYATEKVFETAATALVNKRWLGGDVEPVQSRNVPLAVLLAGAPVDMAA